MHILQLCISLATESVLYFVAIEQRTHNQHFVKVEL